MNIDYSTVAFLAVTFFAGFFGMKFLSAQRDMFRREVNERIKDLEDHIFREQERTWERVSEMNRRIDEHKKFCEDRETSCTNKSYYNTGT